MDEPTTTIKVYAADRDWLQQKQREVSFRRKKTITMWDLMREFVDAMKRAEEGA